MVSTLMEHMVLIILLVAATAFFSFRAGQKSVISKYLDQMNKQKTIMLLVFEKITQCEDLFEQLEKGELTLSEFQEKMDQRLEEIDKN
jgi:uncharacterized protein HemX